MSAPVRHTCHDIDKVIKRLKDALKYANDGKGRTEKGTDEHDYFGYIEDEIYGIEDILEDLRSSNDALRSWGHELEIEVNALEKNVADLEDELEKERAAIS